MTAPKGVKKPTWPYSRRGVVLTANGNGQWSKKYRGKVYFFGPWSEPEAAFEAWQRDWPAVTAGRPREPAAEPGWATVETVTDAFLAEMSAAVGRGERSHRTHRTYREVIGLVLGNLGAQTPVSSLSPADFSRLRTNAANVWGYHRLNNLVNYTRFVFTWAQKNRMLAAVPDFGLGFETVPVAVIRRHRQASGDKSISPAAFAKLLKHSDDVMQAAILLAANGGMGPTDLSTLDMKDCNLRASLIDYVRQKTGAQRIVPLWPETVQAIKRLNPTGRVIPLRDEFIDKRFAMIRDAAGLTCHLYDLRRTFATLAAEALDTDAARVIMGQVLTSVFHGYVQKFPLDRLRKVSQHVRARLGVSRAYRQAQRRGSSSAARARKSA